MRACAIFKLRPEPGINRAVRDVGNLKATLETFSTSLEPVFHTEDGLIFAWLFSTSDPLHTIHRSIYNLSWFQTGDSVLLFDVGTEVETTGFVRQKTWLQKAVTR